MPTPDNPVRGPVIDLTFLAEEEEATLRSVLEEDIRLQQNEENRLKYLDYINTRLSILFNIAL